MSRRVARRVLYRAEQNQQRLCRRRAHTDATARPCARNPVFAAVWRVSGAGICAGGQPKLNRRRVLQQGNGLPPLSWQAAPLDLPRTKADTCSPISRFDDKPGSAKVDFYGIPFFAITHRPGSRRAVSSRSRPRDSGCSMPETSGCSPGARNLRHERAPLAKGVLAFNVLASVAYSGAAFARTGPDERDTRGMAASVRMDERWVGALVLAPASSTPGATTIPDAKWAAWASRGVKVGMVADGGALVTLRPAARPSAVAALAPSANVIVPSTTTFPFDPRDAVEHTHAAAQPPHDRFDFNDVPGWTGRGSGRARCP